MSLNCIIINLNNEQSQSIHRGTSEEKSTELDKADITNENIEILKMNNLGWSL